MTTQRKLVRFFEDYPLLDVCMARKGMSIRDNAAAHAHAKFVLRVDISRCYPSITMNHVRLGLSYANNPDWLLVAQGLSELGMLWTPRGQVLPTGSPISPILCNIALTPLDLAVQRLANNYGYTYTRYIDDLHLSTTQENRHWQLIHEIELLVRAYGLRVNKRKTRWYMVGSDDNVIITGVRIKEGCVVPRKFSRLVRARLQNLARDGQPIDQETRGCLAYIHSIDPERHNSLLQFYNRRLNYEPTQRECISPQ